MSLRFQPIFSALDRLRVENGGFDIAMDMVRRRKANGTIYFIGNGGSAAIASHMAADYTKAGGYRAWCLTDASLLTCLANDLNYAEAYAYVIRRFAQKEDLLVAISSSGQSRNILNAALEAQHKVGMDVITLSGFTEDNPLRRMGRINFYIPSESYGTVEISHLAILHHILDTVKEPT